MLVYPPLYYPLAVNGSQFAGLKASFAHPRRAGGEMALSKVLSFFLTLLIVYFARFFCLLANSAIAVVVQMIVGHGNCMHGSQANPH